MIRRFLTRILITGLIVACGYNLWQVHQLRGELARLRTQVRGGRPALAVEERWSWIDLANMHADRAREALTRGDLGIARAELSRGADDLQRATWEPTAKTKTMIQEARRTLETLQAQADGLRRRARATLP